MNEPTTLNALKEKSSAMLEASFVTVKNALVKAAPVIRTATGGALAIGSAVVMKDFVPHWNQFNDVPANALMLKSLLGSIGAVSTSLGLGGVAMMKKPFGEAVNFFRNKVTQRLAK